VRNRIASIAGGSLAAFCLSAPVAAQTAASAVQQLAPTREEVTRNQAPESLKSSRLLVDGGIERAPCALDDPAYANIKVTITEAQFNNLQGVTPEELRPAYASALGQERPISTICTIRDAAATILRQKGYLAAVQVPVQRIENGVVKFEVLFAKLVAIRVRGDAGKSEKMLAGYLNKLTRDPVFNRFAAERYLLLARDMPGLDVRLSLKPAGTTPGELVGEVSVVKTPFDADLNVQNFAGKGTGRWSGLLRGQAFGLLGNGDRLSASISSTADFKEQQVAQLGYETKFGSEGLTVGGNLTYAWTSPSIDSAVPISLKARTFFATLDTSYPIIRSQKLNLVATGGLDFLNQNVRINGLAFQRDHLRVGFLRLDTDATDISETRTPNWRAFGSIEFRQGLDIFNASKDAISPFILPQTSRPDGDPTSSLIRASGQVEVNMGRGMWLALLPRAQFAFTRLYSFEQYSAGNYTIGRGYDPGVIIGDNGVGTGLEFRWNRFSPLPKYNLQLQPFVFADAAWTWNRDGLPNTKPDKVISLGAGFHAALNNRFRLDGTLAVPMRSAGLRAKRPDPRFLISLTTKLWPWSAR
jgi:hemolysin activation/secretion protein